MDLHTIERIRRPSRADEVTAWEARFAWLAGGTWLFSEPQVDRNTLIPVQLLFETMPAALELARAIDGAVRFSMYFDDVHGSPAHRKLLTYYFVEQIRSDLAHGI
jgi:hypothetical protein